MITAYCLVFEIVRLSALISREFTLAITHMDNIIDFIVVSFFLVNMGNLMWILYDWIQVQRLRI